MRSSSAAFVCSLIYPQLDEARRFWRNKQIRTALIVPWAEAFTAAFLTPVIAYFMQNLRLTPSDMGLLRTVSLVLNAASAPLAGWLLDMYGPFLGIALPSSLCAVGCAIRAFATGFRGLFVASVFSGLSGAKQDMSIAHLSRHTVPLRRTLAVSSARIQLQTLAFLGTACFTPLNALLSVLLPDSSFGMLRYRILISLCTIGCGFGVIVLCLASQTLSFDAAGSHTDKTACAAAPEPGSQAAAAAAMDPRAAYDEEGEPAEKGAICRGSSSARMGAQSNPPSPPSSEHPIHAAAVAPTSSDAQGSSTEPLWCTWLPLGLLLDGSVGGGGVGSGKRSRGVPRALVLLLVALFLGTIYRDLLPIVWPLYIRAHFGWDETQCAHHRASSRPLSARATFHVASRAEAQSSSLHRRRAVAPDDTGPPVLPRRCTLGTRTPRLGPRSTSPRCGMCNRLRGCIHDASSERRR